MAALHVLSVPSDLFLPGQLTNTAKKINMIQQHDMTQQARSPARL